VSASVDPIAAQQLLARWWSAYDEGEFDVLTELLDESATFRCRTDTGATDFEDFVRAEAHGREQVVTWQTQHRLDSPYPLRHHATNFHLTGTDGGEAGFRHYLSVTQVQDVFPTPVPGGVVNGAVRLQEDGSLRIADLEVVLDTMTSVPLRELGRHQEAHT
jgi:hypothetical protein